MTSRRLAAPSGSDAETSPGAPFAGAILRFIGIVMMLSALAVTLAHAPDRSVESLVARWAPPPSDFIVVKGQLVHFRDEGPRADPAPLVLIHGTASSLHTWEGWVAALHGTHRVITFDLPGFGLTGPFTGQYAPDDYHGDTLARFTLDLMDALHVQRFSIGGNSLGGEVAWRVASLAPARVSRLVLVDASGYQFHPVRMPAGFLIARTPVLHYLGEFLTPRSMVEDSVRDVYAHPDRVTAPLVDRYFEMQLREGNRHALSVRLTQLDAGKDVGRLARLAVPTLIVWGDQDRLIPPANAQAFARDIPGASLVMLKDLGHVPQEEDPAASVAPVKAFLDAR
jgi:pimeloyl-ACP methyl ester carboxylesterase